MFVSVEADDQFASQELQAIAHRSSLPGDIEDIGTKQTLFGASSRSVMFTEVHVCSGSVSRVSAEELHVTFSSRPKRLIQ